MIKHFMFTSESVTEGHPDKLCDQISDAVVDHFLIQDPFARVRAECAVSSAIMFIAARFSSTANVDFARLARKVIKRIGYAQPNFDPRTCSILTAPQARPLDESRRIDESELSESEIDRIPALNQVSVFGFACDQSPELMPLPIWLAHRLARRVTAVRREGILPYLMADGKAQVGVEYQDLKPSRVHSVTLEVHQKNPDKPGAKTLLKDIRELVVEPVFQDVDVRPDPKTRINVNPSGPYMGSPAHHSGLTGRKNAVDTYGEFARHSGKALSGKDPMRIDRVGAYAARYAAKNLVAAGLADSCEVMLSYSPGITRPVSIIVQTFGSGKLTNKDLAELVSRHFDFRPAGIVKQFELRHLPSRDARGFYQRLAAYGHFGRQPDADGGFSWERTDLVEALKKAV